MGSNSHVDRSFAAGRRLALSLTATITLATLLAGAHPVPAAGGGTFSESIVPAAGGRYEEVLAHDDGTAESFVTGSPGQMVAVRFQAPEWATHVVGMDFYSANDGMTNPYDPQLPTTQPFVAWLFRPGPDTLPGTPGSNGYVPFAEPYSYPEDEWVRFYFANWIDITDDDLYPDRNFFAGLEWEHRLSPYIGEDTDGPYTPASWRWNWSAWELRGGNLMVRAIVAVESLCVPEVLYVNAAGGSDFENIQDAVDAAQDCDTVYVAPGVYSGPANRGISFGGKNITLRSQEGRSSTVIDCEHQDRGFLFVDGEDEDATVRGFTVRNGLGSGGGIRCVNSWPTIIDCVFTDNDGENYGGAVYCNNAVTPSPTFSHCVFANSVAAVQGGGVLMDFSDAAFENCTFVGNGSSEGGGIHCGVGSCPSFERCIVALGTDGGAAHCPGTSMPTFTNCCVFGNVGGDELCGDHTDNLFADPRFCSAATGDYALREDSPCLPANNEWAVLIGALEQGCSGTAVEEKSWGAIKALYR